MTQPTAVVAEFEIDADAFVLGDVLAGPLDVEVVVERLVPARGELAPYLWVGGADAARFEARAAESRDVESVARVGRSDGWRLVRVEWAADVEALFETLAGARATILDARGADRWHVRARFPGREDLSAFHERCLDRGVDLSLARVRPHPVDPDGGVALTEAQREALELAVARGYFDVPRGITLSDLASELDISTQAASERLRRGTDVALRATLGSGRGPGAD